MSTPAVAERIEAIAIGGSAGGFDAVSTLLELLRQALSSVGVDIDEGALYPLLRRLEAQGLLTSSWNTDETRPRKFYITTEQGDALADTLRTEWARLDRAISDLDTAAAIPGSES